MLVFHATINPPFEVVPGGIGNVGENGAGAGDQVVRGLRDDRESGVDGHRP